MWVAAFSWVLQNSRLIGRMLACASRMLKAVPLSPPVMNLVAQPWMEWSFFVIAMEPHEFLLWANLKGGGHTKCLRCR